MRRMRNVLLAVLAAVFASVIPAKAITWIDFGTGLAGAGGTISFDGTNYYGNDILIGVMTVANNGVATTYVVDGVLDFDTAADVITINGSILDLGITDSLLLSGSFDNFSNSMVTPFFIAFQAEGPDVKSPELLEALEIPVDTKFEYFGFSIAGRLTTDGEYIASSTDIMNTAVPEPGTLLLLGAGLVGMGLMRKKTKKLD